AASAPLARIDHTGQHLHQTRSDRTRIGRARPARAFPLPGPDFAGRSPRGHGELLPGLVVWRHQSSRALPRPPRIPTGVSPKPRINPLHHHNRGPYQAKRTETRTTPEPCPGTKALPLADITGGADWTDTPTLKTRLAGGFCLRAPAQG